MQSNTAGKITSRSPGIKLSSYQRVEEGGDTAKHHPLRRMKALGKPFPAGLTAARPMAHAQLSPSATPACLWQDLFIPLNFSSCFILFYLHTKPGFLRKLNFYFPCCYI